MVVEPGLCGTWSVPPKSGFLTTRLICVNAIYTNHKSESERSVFGEVIYEGHTIRNVNMAVFSTTSGILLK